MMSKRKILSAEQIVMKLREADILLRQISDDEAQLRTEIIRLASKYGRYTCACNAVQAWVSSGHSAGPACQLASQSQTR